MVLLNRVKSVRALPQFKLAVQFRNGMHGVFDCAPYRDYPCFANIWSADVFSKVVADHGTVMWPDGSDLCPDEVYEKTVMES